MFVNVKAAKTYLFTYLLLIISVSYGQRAYAFEQNSMDYSFDSNTQKEEENYQIDANNQPNQPQSDQNQPQNYQQQQRQQQPQNYQQQQQQPQNYQQQHYQQVQQKQPQEQRDYVQPKSDQPKTIQTSQDIESKSYFGIYVINSEPEVEFKLNGQTISDDDDYKIKAKTGAAIRIGFEGTIDDVHNASARSYLQASSVEYEDASITMFTGDLDFILWFDKNKKAGLFLGASLGYGGLTYTEDIVVDEDIKIQLKDKTASSFVYGGKYGLLIKNKVSDDIEVGFEIGYMGLFTNFKTDIDYNIQVTNGFITVTNKGTLTETVNYVGSLYGGVNVMF